MYAALKLGRTGILSTMPRGILILLDNSPKLINCGGGCSVLKTCTDGSVFFGIEIQKNDAKMWHFKGVSWSKNRKFLYDIFCGFRNSIFEKIAKMCDLLGFL